MIHTTGGKEKDEEREENGKKGKEKALPWSLRKGNTSRERGVRLSRISKAWQS